MGPTSIPRRREQELVDLPHHFERVPLRGGLRLVGWPSSVGGAAVGVWCMVTRGGSALEIVGAVLASVAAVMLLWLVRCRAFETTVGVQWIEGRTGPVRYRVPLEFVDAVTVRSARGWRRLYGPTEVVLRLGSGAREVALASLEPDELTSAVADVRQRRVGSARAVRTPDSIPGKASQSASPSSSDG
jgi:hypothetical protein